MSRRAIAITALLALGSPVLALAAEPVDAGAFGADAAAPPASAEPALPAAPSASASPVFGTCVEHIPSGVPRPEVKEEFPSKGTTGYAADLRIVITHGKGETVLPEGVRLQPSSDGAKAVEEAGFVIPDVSSPVKPGIKVDTSGAAKAVSTVTVPFVPLPKKPGRRTLVLPPLPIAVARANNDHLVLCTKAHTITVEDPIANELTPRVKPNPPPRTQRVDWPLARNLAIGIPLGALACVVAILLYRYWQRRPKVVPEPPKIPPWVTALEELRVIRSSDMLTKKKTDEYFDRVCDAVRKYLGGRYGFETLEQGYNGLETTTAEMLDLLERVEPPIAELPRIKVFLEECDLVKFARLLPDERDCIAALERGEKIVLRTMPTAQAFGPTTKPPPAPPPSMEDAP